jgi:hypothetical protein
VEAKVTPTSPFRHLAALLFSAVIVFAAGAVFSDDDVSESNGRVAGDKGGITRAQSERWPPQIDYRIHRNGRLWNTMNNNGIIGNVYGAQMTDPSRSGPTLEFPGYSRITHGTSIGLWVGGVVGNDTLVSSTNDDVGNREFFPDYYPFGQFHVRSNVKSSPYYDRLAKAEMEMTCMYADTFHREEWVPYSAYDYRRHEPLNLVVRQTSYSWSPGYAADFIMVDYVIHNVGRQRIRSAWVGLYYTGYIWHKGELPFVLPDENAGYMATAPHEFEELGDETMRIAWVTDHDGRSSAFSWSFINTPHALGIAPLRTPEGADVNNFNWWVNDRYMNWGPRMASNDEYVLRRYFGGLGQPYSDINRYHLMAKPEVDYSSFEAGVNHVANGWLQRPRGAKRIYDGAAINMVTSFGPFDLKPREAETLTVAIAMGEDVHSDPDAYTELFSGWYPYEFLNYLDWDPLISSVRWAKTIFDNPGVDTDGDGYSGEAFWRYDEDTGDSVWQYYAGDGVPDYRGATPPPPPDIRVFPENGKLVVRWNGYSTEAATDPMTRIKDFEGYRVWLSRSSGPEEAFLVASWDRENYNRYEYNYTRGRWELKDLPFSIDSLKTMYGQDFEPLRFTRENPFQRASRLFFFTPVDHNQSNDRDPSGIHRVYPDAPRDPEVVDENGNPRYWEWEYVIDDLSPSIPYHVSVTAFDFGHAPRSLESLESRVDANQREFFALDRGEDAVPDGNLQVYCFPNPYRADQRYWARGYENRLSEIAPERARAIWFANLPERCTITIYSLDGDRIRRIEHDQPGASGIASIERWDLISRNRESVVSGLYYWVVESEFGTQIGKLVIIK